MYKKWSGRVGFFLVTLFIFTGIVFAAQNSDDDVWSVVAKSQLRQPGIDSAALPAAYQTFRLNKSALKGKLDSAPEEFTSGRGTAQEVILTLPMPDGSYSRFRVEHSLVVEPGLLATYPELGATYRGQGIDDPTATARFDFLPNGFHSMILSSNGEVVVNPYQEGDTDNYSSAFKRDMPRTSDFKCLVAGDGGFESVSKTETPALDSLLPAAAPEVVSGTQLRTYRLAVAATNEYASAVGGNTIAGTLAAQVLIMNRVNGVYERDLAIHMNIVANNNLIIYAGDNMSCGGVACTAANDPYSNSSASSLLSQNQATIDSVIGNANYDIGHVFSTAGGGLSDVGVPCQAGVKAESETGLSNPVGDAFAIDYVAHEMGHEWGALHTFNGTVSSCGGGNRTGADAYEPGSGISIMAYAGICGSQNLAAHSIDTFHVKSLEEIVAYSQSGGGNGCAVTTATNNTPPVVTGPGNFNIPKQTPFSLTATATDANNDSITYDWEEYDLGVSTTAVPNTDSDGSARPVFRPYVPSVSGTRTFPSLTYVLNNANVPPSTTGGFLTGELLPAIARTMTFQVVARDNHAGGGGIGTASSVVTVDGNSGPFAITSPNTNVTYAGGSIQTVTWNVANTTNAPVNAANVKISYSTDGGNTFPVVLAANVPNNGSRAVTIPIGVTTTGRIKIEAAGNIFFDISDTNFTVSGALQQNRAISDFDGDGKSDIAVWRESNGIWFTTSSLNGTAAAPFQFGTAGDKIVPGDYDGDGKADFAVWRPSTGIWYIQRSTAGFTAVQWGISGDVPVQGDFDGDGKTDIAVWRPSNGIWYIIQSSAGYTATQFGQPGDKPVVGDYDGDGKADVAVYRPQGGIWFERRSTLGDTAIQFGISTDMVAPADYDGDGKTDLAVYRDGPLGVWYIQQSSAGYMAKQFGTTGDIPSVGDFDGDGKADISVFRPSNGIWFIQRSTSGFLATQYGQNLDKPVTSGYVPN